MPVVHLELTAIGEDESRRRRQQRRGVKALAVLAGLALLAFAGREPEPALRLASASTDFGAQPVGARATRTVSLRNTTGEPFVVAGIVAEGAATQTEFDVDLTRCARIAPDADCSAAVSFTPREAGPRSASFRVIDADNEASETIMVRGAGVIPVEPVTPPPPPPPPPPPAPRPEPAVVVKPPARPPVRAIDAPKPRPEDLEIVDEALPPEPAPSEPLQPSQPPQPKESRGKNILKKVAAVAIPIAIGAVIANNSDRGGRRSSERRSEKRIEATQTNNGITVTNVGTEPVTIQSVSRATPSGMLQLPNDCRTLAPGQQCFIARRGGGTVVIDSDAGQLTIP